jgi:hypothetical protein
LRCAEASSFAAIKLTVDGFKGACGFLPLLPLFLPLVQPPLSLLAADAEASHAALKQ